MHLPWRRSSSDAPPPQGEAVDHPSHYNAHPKGIECIDVIEDWPFNVATACKYLWRCDHKGNDVEDLRKAVWYIEREISRRQSQHG
jgi:hypothetical protein